MSWRPLKRSMGMAVVVEGQEGVVLLRGEAGLRLEPVAEVGRALLEGPLLDGVGDLVRDRASSLVPRRIVS
jgi:hypothetical protein